MDIATAAAILRISKNGLRNMVGRGAIPGQKVTVGDRDDIWDLDPAVVEAYRVNASRRADAPTRFWRKVRKTETCWIWTAAHTTFGYGSFAPTVGSPKLVGAHRWAWEDANGPIPKGLHLDHLCRNPPCVNPAHLEPVTPAENLRRGTASDHERAKTHCPRGHPYSGANLFLRRDKPGRECRICRRERMAARA